MTTAPTGAAVVGTPLAISSISLASNYNVDTFALDENTVVLAKIGTDSGYTHITAQAQAFDVSGANPLLVGSVAVTNVATEPSFSVDETQAGTGRGANGVGLIVATYLTDTNTRVLAIPVKYSGGALTLGTPLQVRTAANPSNATYALSICRLALASDGNYVLVVSDRVNVYAHQLLVNSTAMTVSAGWSSQVALPDSSPSLSRGLDIARVGTQLLVYQSQGYAFLSNAGVFGTFHVGRPTGVDDTNIYGTFPVIAEDVTDHTARMAFHGQAYVDASGAVSTSTLNTTIDPFGLPRRIYQGAWVEAVSVSGQPRSRLRLTTSGNENAGSPIALTSDQTLPSGSNEGVNRVVLAGTRYAVFTQDTIYIVALSFVVPKAIATLGSAPHFESISGSPIKSLAEMVWHTVDGT